MPMVLELFGHQRIAGYVSEYNFAGSSFVRVDVPEVGNTPAFSKMFHPNAREANLGVARTATEDLFDEASWLE